jgi:hypothetical protein
LVPVAAVIGLSISCLWRHAEIRAQFFLRHGYDESVDIRHGTLRFGVRGR